MLPTQAQFALSRAVVVIIAGPMGESKTFGGILGIFAHFERCRRALLKLGIPLEVAIVRDTHENIKRSIVKVFGEFFGANPGIRYDWRTDYKHLTLHTNPKITCDLFGVDDLPSLTKLQGSAYSCIWLDDPVPYTDAERTNAGHESSF